MSRTVLAALGNVLSQSTRFVIEECYKCHVQFAITQQHYEYCRERGYEFYCPNGHPQHYSESDIQRLTKERDSARSDSRYYQNRVTEIGEEKRKVEKSRAAYKGKVTEIKRRVAHGVCPCCNRTFKQLARHMKSQHPNYVDEPDISAEAEE